MDPDANLIEQIDLARAILAKDDALTPEDHARLAELVLALDTWIRDGGFLPAGWRAR